MRLAQLQNDFQVYLQDSMQGTSFKEHIVNDKQVGASKRLGIYYDAYRLRIIDALASAYPKLNMFLGDAQFNQIARNYIDAYPSTYRNMRWVGDQMALHLHKTHSKQPLASELASFEWALGLAFDAQDAPVIGLQALTNIAPEQWEHMCFTMHPSVQMLNFQYPVTKLWQILDAQELITKQAKAKQAAWIKQANQSPTATVCLVWRKALSAYYKTLDSNELQCLQTVVAGQSFGDLCLSLQAQLDEQAAMQQAAQYLSTWLNDELISAVHVKA